MSSFWISCLSQFEQELPPQQFNTWIRPLRLEGEARTGTQRLSLQTQATGGLSGAGQWQAQWSQLRAQWQDTRRPGVWTAQLTQPWAMSLRTGASHSQSKTPSP